MESDREILDTKLTEDTPQQDNESDKEKHQQLTKNTGSARINRKVVWNSTAEKETFRTVVLSCNISERHKDLGAIPKRRETLSTTTNLSKMKLADQYSNIYNLREMYQMSHDSLCDGKCPQDTQQCEPSTSTTVIPTKASRRTNSGSRHSIKVDIFNMPPLQKAEIIERPLIQLTSNDGQGNKKKVSKASRNSYDKSEKRLGGKGKSYSSHSIKLEIFHMPMSQNVEMPIQFYEIVPQEADIIIISGDDDNTQIKSSDDVAKVEQTDDVSHKLLLTEDVVPTNMEPKILQTKEDSADTITNMEETSTKSTQKPEGLMETHSQTSESVELQQKSLQISSALSPSSRESISRSTPLYSLHKQRQLELHRLRLQVERKRLELLEMKLDHERQQMQNDQKLFDRDIDMIRWMCRVLNGEKEV